EVSVRLILVIVIRVEERVKAAGALGAVGNGQRVLVDYMEVLQPLGRELEERPLAASGLRGLGGIARVGGEARAARGARGGNSTEEEHQTLVPFQNVDLAGAGRGHWVPAPGDARGAPLHSISDGIRVEDAREQRGEVVDRILGQL